MKAKGTGVTKRKEVPIAAVPLLGKVFASTAKSRQRWSKGGLGVAPHQQAVAAAVIQAHGPSW